MLFDISSPGVPLDQLRDLPVDLVLSSIDENLVNLPTYRDLYNRWERQQWKTQDLNFIPDRIQWEDFEEVERSEHLSGMAMFFQGEVSVTDALGAYIRAVPDEEMRIFLTTQQVDEARHAVFFDKFFCEVLEIDKGSLEDTLASLNQYINPAARYLLLESLRAVAEALRCEPENRALLVEGVVLYHLVIESMMALSAQRTLLEAYRRENFFPTFRTGMMALTRDESRHILFGVRFLRDMLQQDLQYLPVVATALEKYAPSALSALTPSDDIVQLMLGRREDPWKAPRYACESLHKKLRIIGLNVELPAIPAAPLASL
jgi:ribonucleoside-diphosphate reductase beta chain